MSGNRIRTGRLLLRLLIISISGTLFAAEVQLGGRTFTLPDGFHLSFAAQAPLTSRPICVDQDEQGHLYVAESSGSNADVQTQLQERPHQILRLTDHDQDGVYDQRTVFVDRIMLPEGALWHEGALYVAAPPVIWKFRDNDGDGLAEQRDVWFDGKTLTGCANDLHGPFLGPDGWIYWCKGAFAEQQHELTKGDQLNTRAAHIFRRHPQGGPLEVVMTGGMDNPVEVVFTPAGERIFSTTFLQHPAGGRRDGLIHAIYGGVYGKEHGVLNGHVRTGDLLPPMTHLGAAAPSGLARLRSDRLGLAGQVVTACFNLHAVTRHELSAQGARLQSTDAVLLETKDLDFHPTDVLEDADGSLLIVDTGGWYKLCCPTSSLHKPDIAGGIYRLSRSHMAPADPWGRQLKWTDVRNETLVQRLGDSRPRVRDAAQRMLLSRGDDVISALASATTGLDPDQARRAVWTLCRLSSPEARAAIRTKLADTPSTARHAAIHSVSLWRDRQAQAALQAILAEGTPAEQRAAAEALGRLGQTTSIPTLFTTLAAVHDRILQHSLIYALIEIGDQEAIRTGLASPSARVVEAALMALDQLPDAQLQPGEVCPHLVTSDRALRQTAAKIAARHPSWADAIWNQLGPIREKAAWSQEDVQLVQQLSENPAVMKLLLPAISERLALREHLGLLAGLSRVPLEGLESTVANLVQSKHAPTALATVRALAARSSPLPAAVQHAIAQRTLDGDEELRLEAIALLASPPRETYAFLLSQVDQDQPAKRRALAASILARHSGDAERLRQLAADLGRVGPLELRTVLSAFDSGKHPALAPLFFHALAQHPHLDVLPAQQVESLTKGFHGSASHALRSRLRSDMLDLTAENRRLTRLLKELPVGDARRGEQVFHSEKTACFSCHAIGYRGGKVGPDLSRIAQVRNRANLLESILYPSRSFVRSYEPVTVITSSGQVIAGTIRDQTDEQMVIQTSATTQEVIATTLIAERRPGAVSLMPQGIEKQLSLQELADLLRFLETRK